MKSKKKNVVKSFQEPMEAKHGSSLPVELLMQEFRMTIDV
jgi:hypothetical protein